MNKRGPILIIEDNKADQHLFTLAFKELDFRNEIIFFEDGELALDHLLNTPVEPFIIFSDINMPRLNGLELRAQVHNNEDLRLKCIPYLFFSTSGNQQHVIDAYSKSVQGFFIKPVEYDRLTTMIKKIVEYWQECESPNYIK